VVVELTGLYHRLKTKRTRKDMIIKNSLITVWDPLIRVFHWLLVAVFLTGYLTQEQNYELHLQAGYLVLALVNVRLLWGLVGSKYARFKTFIYSPSIISGYIKSLAKGQARRYIGHNPAGGAMVILLLTGLLTVTISGIALDGAENWSGPMAEMNLYHHTGLIQSIHVFSTNTLLLLITLHILGVTLSSFIHHENLVKAMLNGKKRNH